MIRLFFSWSLLRGNRCVSNFIPFHYLNSLIQIQLIWCGKQKLDIISFTCWCPHWRSQNQLLHGKARDLSYPPTLHPSTSSLVPAVRYLNQTPWSQIQCSRKKNHWQFRWQRLLKRRQVLDCLRANCCYVFTCLARHYASSFTSRWHSCTLAVNERLQQHPIHF